jgi:hypothetical protein
MRLIYVSVLTVMFGACSSGQTTNQRSGVASTSAQSSANSQVMPVGSTSDMPAQAQSNAPQVAVSADHASVDLSYAMSSAAQDNSAAALDDDTTQSSKNMQVKCHDSRQNAANLTLTLELVEQGGSSLDSLTVQLASCRRLQLSFSGLASGFYGLTLIYTDSSQTLFTANFDLTVVEQGDNNDQITALTSEMPSTVSASNSGGANPQAPQHLQTPSPNHNAGGDASGGVVGSSGASGGFEGGNPSGGNHRGGGNPSGGTPLGGGNPSGGTPLGGGNPSGGTPLGGGNPSGGTPLGGGNPSGGTPLGGGNPSGGTPLGGGNPSGGTPLGGGNPSGGTPLGGSSGSGGTESACTQCVMDAEGPTMYRDCQLMGPCVFPKQCLQVCGY